MSDEEPTEHPEVTIATGRVRGLWREDAAADGDRVRSAAFLGIPFAEPPVGPLRFAAPVPVSPWDGVFDAAEYGATAQRGDTGITLIPEPSIPGTSTLNVNVFTPSPEPASPGLPVLVWIHGGGFISGSPASPWYDGRAFNRDGVVTVSLSYRLGFDGFGWIADAPSNRGVRDWLLGLEWVRENIAAFGGDPSRVTIAGQSAGGGAVLTLLGMEQAQHLFHGVYASSPALADVTAERAEGIGRDVAQRLGVEPTREGLSTRSEEDVHAAQDKAVPLDLSSIGDGLALGPVVDGDLMLRPTLESWRVGVGRDVPLVLGASDDEVGMVFAGKERLVGLVPRWLLLRMFGVPWGRTGMYIDANADVAALGTARLAGRALGDMVFRRQMPGYLEARGDAPTWLYRFSWPSGAFGLACHCLDVPFLFDCLDGPAVGHLTGPQPPQSLADDVHRAATAFVTGGAPGWPRNDARDRTTHVFDVPGHDMSNGYASVHPLL
jgi:para-nitrobenzyl esterase